MGHDEAIDFEQTVELIGDRALAEQVRDATLAVYAKVAAHARERGIILADTKLEFGLDDDGELVLGDEVCTPDSSRFWPRRATRPAAGSRASTSSTCATGRRARAGTRRRRRRRSRTTSSPRTRELYVEAYEMLTGEPFDAWLERTAPHEGARPDPAEGGHPRPAGPDRRARAAGARASTGVSNVHVGRLVELDVEDPARLPEMCEALLANPLIEDYEIVQ